MVAGGRFGAAGETTTGHGPREVCIPEGCQNRAYASKTSLLPSTAEGRLAEPQAPILGAGSGARLLAVSPISAFQLFSFSGCASAPLLDLLSSYAGPPFPVGNMAFSPSFRFTGPESRNTLQPLSLRRNPAGFNWLPIAPLPRSPPARPVIAFSCTLRQKRSRKHHMWGTQESSNHNR